MATDEPGVVIQNPLARTALEILITHGPMTASQLEHHAGTVRHGMYRVLLALHQREFVARERSRRAAPYVYVALRDPAELPTLSREAWSNRSNPRTTLGETIKMAGGPKAPLARMRREEQRAQIQDDLEDYRRSGGRITRLPGPVDPRAATTAHRHLR